MSSPTIHTERRSLLVSFINTNPLQAHRRTTHTHNIQSSPPPASRSQHISINVPNLQVTDKDHPTAPGRYEYLWTLHPRIAQGPFSSHTSRTVKFLRPGRSTPRTAHTVAHYRINPYVLGPCSVDPVPLCIGDLHANNALVVSLTKLIPFHNHS
ncbi:hypothetical protein BU25DRAFT_38644 [Macroventuria anomochaeta]|uniref:Uncharacterized protein n=1 Tax=Macroventuria anomochaeta TaxID=301207 RepID=A0ACB6S270_9PLEO|nr:uncharacterized protein BU25DRAFT_38644 [Macroventuria anomochaeta]KAF2628033.1 hypothetical protein BU25DRAFT_38644 [Macroventuria anomochaeta]